MNEVLSPSFFFASFMDSFRIWLIHICAIGTIKLRPIDPESSMEYIILYMKSDDVVYDVVRGKIGVFMKVRVFSKLIIYQVYAFL